jgi:hypothetical protein
VVCDRLHHWIEKSKRYNRYSRNANFACAYVPELRTEGRQRSAFLPPLFETEQVRTTEVIAMSKRGRNTKENTRNHRKDSTTVKRSRSKGFRLARADHIRTQFKKNNSVHQDRSNTELGYTNTRIHSTSSARSNLRSSFLTGVLLTEVARTMVGLVFLGLIGTKEEACQL